METQTSEIIKVILAIIGSIVGAFSLYKAFMEYHRQGVVKKMDVLIQMRTRLREDPVFSNICGLLENDSEKLREVPLIEKDRFIGFFEELMLIKNSGLINDHVAVYMFGYYAEKCLDSKNFWFGLNKKEVLWSAFIDFAEDTKKTHADFTYSKKTFKM